MSSLAALTEGRIDFVGQKLVDQISRFVLIAGAIISFLAGFILQDLRVTFGLYGAIIVVLALVVLPPWPLFNKHPVQWLPVVDSKSPAGVTDSEKPKSGILSPTLK